MIYTRTQLAATIFTIVFFTMYIDERAIVSFGKYNAVCTVTDSRSVVLDGLTYRNTTYNVVPVDTSIKPYTTTTQSHSRTCRIGEVMNCIVNRNRYIEKYRHFYQGVDLHTYAISTAALMATTTVALTYVSMCK